MSLSDGRLPGKHRGKFDLLNWTGLNTSKPTVTALFHSKAWSPPVCHVARFSGFLITQHWPFPLKSSGFSLSHSNLVSVFVDFPISCCLWVFGHCGAAAPVRGRPHDPRPGRLPARGGDRVQSSYFDVTAAHDRQGLIKRLEHYGRQQHRAPAVKENCKNDTSFAAHLWYMLANKISCEELEGKKRQRHYFANKGLSSQSYIFSSSHIWMWEVDCRESWELKSWCFWTVVLEKTLEMPLDCKEIQPVSQS